MGSFLAMCAVIALMIAGWMAFSAWFNNPYTTPCFAGSLSVVAVSITGGGGGFSARSSLASFFSA